VYRQNDPLTTTGERRLADARYARAHRLELHVRDLQQAGVLFELASKMSVKADAERLIRRANEHQLLAEAMPPDEEAANEPPPAVSPLTITQLMQQQQLQIGEADDKDNK